MSRHQRLLRLEGVVRERKVEITDEQVRLLERFSPEFRDRHIETRHTGDLVAVDTFFVGTLKGVGRVYLQSVIDCHSRYAWGRLYTTKLPVTAVHVLNQDVLPFFERHDAVITTVLSDNGREYCGRPDRHPYELFLHLNGVEHTKTKPRHPQTNGCVEKLNQTVQEEFYKVAFRKKLYKTIEEIQADLDAFMAWYNAERTNHGRYCQGRTPLQTFMDGLELYQRYVYENPVEEKEVMM